MLTVERRTELLEALRHGMPEDDELDSMLVSDIDAIQPFIERWIEEAEKAQTEALVRWATSHSFATGHADKFVDLLTELSWQIAELRVKANGHAPDCPLGVNGIRAYEEAIDAFQSTPPEARATEADQQALAQAEFELVMKQVCRCGLKDRDREYAQPKRIAS